MRKTALNTALWTTLVVSLGVSLSACSGGHEEVKAPERVEEAAEIARANAPEAEDMEFAETEPMVVATADTAGTEDEDVDMAASAVAEESAGDSEDLAVNVGAELYDKQCMACHATGLLNAPKYGDAAAWAPRIEKGVATLTDHSANGFNQMPAQAYNGVTEDQIKAAVEYMIAAAS
ncbi:c-type cytochrome [Psychrobacter sp. 1Y11]|uniref:c-type cytochrome n=1 Tax=Psychrobacter sp. 1Y11 TaxID=3457446 RepID=UPI003FD1C07E